MQQKNTGGLHKGYRDCDANNMRTRGLFHYPNPNPKRGAFLNNITTTIDERRERDRGSRLLEDRSLTIQYRICMDLNRSGAFETRASQCNFIELAILVCRCCDWTYHRLTRVVF